MPKVTEAHRAARREQIVTAMLRCVEREGFHKTTMAAVIEESGLSAGAVYLYFKSKQDLIRAIAEIAVSGVGSAIAELADAEQVVPPPEALRRATGRFLTLSEELGVDVPKIAIQAWAEASRDREIRDIIAAEAGRIRTAWETYVARAAAAGLIGEDAQPERTARVLMGLLPGFILQRVIFGDVEPEEYGAGLGDLLG
jgi:AcrR family transcriptional regulator